MEVLLWVWFFGLALVVLLWRSSQGRTTRPTRPASYAEERDQQPDEIARGRLVLSEFYLRCDVPRRLGARVDQVYMTPAGMLVPVDTKVRYRHEIRMDDVIELSVQAAVLRHTTSSRRPSGEVASWGYVRIAPPGRRAAYLRTELLSDLELARAYERYFELVDGAQPLPAAVTRSCRHCSKREGCPAHSVAAVD